MNELLKAFDSLLTGLEYLIESLMGFAEWVPEFLEMSPLITSLVPYPFLACAGLIATIYIIKVCIGSSNS